jgi:hypothetical protein
MHKIEPEPLRVFDDSKGKNRFTYLIFALDPCSLDKLHSVRLRHVNHVDP